MAFGAFHYKSVDNRKGFLFIRWGKQTDNFWASTQTITLNQTLYAQVRDTVAEALGASAKIADLRRQIADVVSFRPLLSQRRGTRSKRH